MPKGVEHRTRGNQRALHLGVDSSVMPKGVEHTRWLSLALALFLVDSSVMPKGVEHEQAFAGYAALPPWIHL